MEGNKSGAFTYRGEHLSEISFPLGGIGAGCIGLGGNGRLMDWEIFNRPNKNSTNGYSFFAIKAERQGKVLGTRVLNGDYGKLYMGEGQGNNRFGSGVNRETMAGFPHFREVTFTGTYPIATLGFAAGGIPLDVRMTAYNPLIPLNDRDSSLPAAIFRFHVRNASNGPVDVTLYGNIYNPHCRQSENRWFDEGIQRGLRFASTAYEPGDRDFGELALSTSWQDVSRQTYLYRGRWFDAMTLLWQDMDRPGRLVDRIYDAPYDDNNQNQAFVFRDAGALACHCTLGPGESAEIPFVLSWYYPNCANYWNPGEERDGEGRPILPTWKNYYAGLFDNAAQVSAYIWEQFERLYRETAAFRDELFGSTLPAYVLDAIAGNLSTLKSPTCLRLPDGTLYGFEGCHPQWESCEGSCTHVWNYDMTTPFLFPSLARSMHGIHYKYCGDKNGKFFFRMMLPPERTGHLFPAHNGPDRAAVDGQMGTIMRVFREWKLSGDTGWMRKLWPQVKKALEYAWHPGNEYCWDADKDGILEGRQHQTLDVELFGPNAYLSGLYQGALLAGAEMAEAVGETESASEYRSLFQKGNSWLNRNLFNGEYYYQRIDLADSRYPVDREIGQIKNQIGEGCHIDQTIAQWHAAVCGLDRIFDLEQNRKALESVYRYNYLTLGEYPNPCRIFALNDEKGVVVCTWPRGNMPKVPVPYSGECMYGMEYQAACNMLFEGLTEKGLEIVRECRARFDGKRRNPWNEYESGSNYARSMAAYSLLIALSGFRYDLTKGFLGFQPQVPEDSFRCFWSVGTGWGRFETGKSGSTLTLLYGELSLDSLAVPDCTGIRSATLDGKDLSFQPVEDKIQFAQPAQLHAGSKLQLNT